MSNRKDTWFYYVQSMLDSPSVEVVYLEEVTLIDRQTREVIGVVKPPPATK